MGGKQKIDNLHGENNKMNKVQEWEDSLMKFEKIKQLKAQMKQLGVPAEIKVVHVLAAGCCLFLLMVYLFSGMRAITNLVAFVYPAWETLKALRTPDKKDDTKWLTYWVFYAVVQVMESITDLFFFWVPMYELMKMLIYKMVVEPLNGTLSAIDAQLQQAVSMGAESA